MGDCTVALAQRCALKKIAADKACVAVTDSNFINVDIQMRINLPHIFAIGDAVGRPMLGTRRCTKRTWRLK